MDEEAVAFMEIDGFVDQIETGDESLQTLNGLQDFLEEKKDNNEPVTQNEAELVEIAFESILSRLGSKRKASKISTESFTQDSVLALEADIKATAKGVWERIVAFFKDLWKKIQSYLSSAKSKENKQVIEELLKQKRGKTKQKKESLQSFSDFGLFVDPNGKTASVKSAKDAFDRIDTLIYNVKGFAQSFEAFIVRDVKDGDVERFETFKKHIVHAVGTGLKGEMKSLGKETVSIYKGFPFGKSLVMSFSNATETDIGLRFHFEVTETHDQGSHTVPYLKANEIQEFWIEVRHLAGYIDDFDKVFEAIVAALEKCGSELGEGSKNNVALASSLVKAVAKLASELVKLHQSTVSVAEIFIIRSLENLE